MNVLSIYAHHEPSSLTASLKNVATSVLTRQGHTVVETDLYGMGFSPTAHKYDFTQTSGRHFNYMLEQKNAVTNGMAFAPDILAELEKVAAADLLLFHAPIWWQGVPAILKGWFDRVLVMGAAWDGGRIYEKGLLRGKQAMLCVVAGGPQDFYSERGKHKTTMNQILHPVQHGTFSMCGMDVLEPFVVYNALGLAPGQADRILADYEFRVQTLVQSPVFWHTYDSEPNNV